MAERRPVNRKSRVTRQTEEKRPRTPLSRRGRMTIAVLAGIGLGLGAGAHVWTQGPDARADAIPLVASSPLAKPAAIKPEAPVAVPTSAADLVPPDALDLKAAKVVDGRYVIELADGRRVTLTLIPALQQRAEQVLQKYDVPIGALVAVEPATGRVLALADHSAERPGRRFALEATQPAASVFKIITTAALVEGEGVSPDQKTCYHGGLHGITKQHITDNPKADTACITLAQALGKSTNPVFAKLADRLLDRAELTAWAERFGFNARIPFVMDVQPSRADFPEDRVKYAASAAGFHHTKLSPLHAALFMGALGNDGRMLEPQIVDRIERGGVTIYEAKPRELRQVVSPETARTVTRMMVTTTTEGTAAKYFKKAEPPLQGVAIAGKTGSLSSKDGGIGHFNTWFVGLAPAEAPQIAVAALVSNAGAWRIKGTHLGRAALEAYFKVHPATAVKR